MQHSLSYHLKSLVSSLVRTLNEDHSKAIPQYLLMLYVSQHDGGMFYILALQFSRAPTIKDIDYRERHLSFILG